jgi:hypothetical protein
MGDYCPSDLLLQPGIDHERLPALTLLFHVVLPALVSSQQAYTQLLLLQGRARDACRHNYDSILPPACSCNCSISSVCRLLANSAQLSICLLFAWPTLYTPASQSTAQHTLHAVNSAHWIRHR